MSHHTPRSRLHCLLALFTLVAITACGAEEERASTGGRYLASSWVASDDGTNTYIALFDSLDRDEPLDFGTALEVPGYGDAWVYDEWVFVVDGEAPIVTRYVIADGALTPESALSFANEGVFGAAFYDNQILSRNKAYLANSQNREYIVWNPSTMEITGHVPWPEVDFGEGFAPFHSYLDRGGEVVGKYFFHGIYAHDEDFTQFSDRSIVGVYDIETDELVKTINVPCPMMDVASLGDDGYLYLSAWSYIPLSYLSGLTPKSCAARIDIETQTLDTEWTFDWADVTDGDQASALRALPGGQGIFAVFHGTDIEPTGDIWDLDAGDNDWELYTIDLATKAVAPTGVLFGDGSYYESHVGDGYFVYLGNGGDTQVYERTSVGYEPRFSATGWMSRLFALER